MRSMGMLGLAAGLVALGIAVLGTRWDGIEVSPGVWRDSVGLGQWATLWGTLVIVGLAAAVWLLRWRTRLLVVLPLLVWIGWSLRGGTLLPIAFAIYAAPTVLAWCAGLLLGDGACMLARSVKRAGT